MTSCAARVACGVQITEEFLARVHALSRIAASQLPTIFRGATCFADWHVDAVDRAALAGLQADEFRGAAGRFWFCESDSHFIAGVDRRICRRPLRPTSQRHRHADGIDDFGVRAGGADAYRGDSRSAWS